MTFLVLAAVCHRLIDAKKFSETIGGLPITWFDPTNPGLGGAICLSPLATQARLQMSDRCNCLLVGRVRLDRREELRAKLADNLPMDNGRATDAELCLHAYARWGSTFVEQIHGDFAFVIHDALTRELICVRDRFGVRTLVWHSNDQGFWVAGSMHELCNAIRLDGLDLDPTWVTDFLRTGTCSNPSRSVYAGVRRLPAAGVLVLGDKEITERRYWSLAVQAPIQLASAAAYQETFHSLLDLAIRDRLPPDRLGIMLSGGLDSSTLAAKAKQLGGEQLRLAARTWLVGGDVDPEARASERVAAFLRLDRTVVDAGCLQFDPSWSVKSISTPEPSLEVLTPPERLEDTLAMRSQAACWFYGEGPDNALIFEWRMHLAWLWQHREWQRLPGVIASYFATKSLRDWKTTIQSRIASFRQPRMKMLGEPDWVRPASMTQKEEKSFEWRPRAHEGFVNPLWQSLFEELDAEGDRVGIEWRHPFMDLRVLEFMLATPPIPWARHKLLLRRAMQGYLPEETLRRPKTPLYRDDLGELLRRHLPPMPRPGDAIEEFVDLAKLPAEPHAYPDIYALTRVAIVQHWLQTRNG